MTNTGRLTTALAGRYRIERQLGAGGMATVYLAQDLKHDRQVALKVLRPELAAVLGAERFVQEIKTTAALQHPHILPLFDSGTADGFLFYVMPYVQGETLREKLDRETQLGVEEAVRITTEVADALHAAHQQGVIHRDIKPENILLQNGRPMVADFGIALAVSAAAGGRMTETGLSLGTPHYMSPEQATADKDISARSDIYSLGTVLYEMLTGDPPHTGSSAQQIIMKIVTEEAAPVTKARKSVPPNVAAAVAKAIEKLPADRFDSAQAFAAALGNPGFTSATQALPGRTALPPYRHTAFRLLGATTILLALALAWSLAGRVEPAAAPSLRAFLSDTVVTGERGDVGLAVSPDGETVFFAVGSDQGTTLFVRGFGEDGFRRLDDVPMPRMLQVSPDGRHLLFLEPRAFGEGVVLRLMPLTGGPAVLVADSVTGAAGWCDDGSLLVLRGGEVLRIAEAGGAPVLLVTLDSVPIAGASALPDCRGLLFSDLGGGNGRLLLLDLRTGAVTQLADQGAAPRYVSSGHILFMSARPNPALMALPFDDRRRQVTGPPVPLVSRIGGWDVSKNGTLVYYEATAAEAGERLAWVDTLGRVAPLPINLPDFETPRLSPDGRRIAILDFNARTLLLYEISTGATTRLGTAGLYCWSADGQALFVSTDRAILRVPADGTGLVDTLYRGVARVFAASPDQTSLVIGIRVPGQGWDISVLRLDGGAPAVVPYLHANWDERQPALSPDGRWLAYVSNESGTNEVYVRAFPVPGDLLRVSDGGGAGPAWGPDGAAIFYAAPDAMVRAQLATAGSGLTVRSRTRLFPHQRLEVTTLASFQRANLPRRWDVAADGRRFLMVNSPEEVFDSGVKLRVITNIFDEIRRREIVR